MMTTDLPGLAATASIVKPLLAPALVGLASWVARRWGPGAGGWFTALPLTSGPVMLIVALEHGRGFASQACVGILLALTSLAAFALAYSWSARWLSWGWSSLAGCAAYLAASAALRFVSASLAGTFLTVCVLLLATTRLMPGGAGRQQAAVAPAWDVPLRMLLAAALVVGLTHAAGAFGPRLSGLLTPFPVVATILAAFTHHFEGAAAAAELLRCLLAGLYSFAVFFLVVGLTIGLWSVGASFAAATLGALAVHAGVWHWAGVRRA